MMKQATTLLSAVTVLVAVAEPTVRDYALAQHNVGGGAFFVEVPEAGGMVLLGIALVALAGIVRRR